MKIIVKNKKELDEFKSDKPYVLIEFVCSSTEPSTNVFDTCVSHLTLTVDDIDSEVEGLELFDEADAESIAFVVMDHLDDINFIVCKCDAGRSRSAAVAAALDRYINYKDDFTGNPKYNPNIHILRLTYKTLEKHYGIT